MAQDGELEAENGDCPAKPLNGALFVALGDFLYIVKFLGSLYLNQII